MYETIVPSAGLAAFEEYLRGLGLHEEVHRFLPKPGSGRGGVGVRAAPPAHGVLRLVLEAG